MVCRHMKGLSQEQVACRCLRTLAALWKRGAVPSDTTTAEPIGEICLHDFCSLHPFHFQRCDISHVRDDGLIFTLTPVL